MNNKVSVYRCGEYEPEGLKTALEGLLEPLGGLSWVNKGMKIALKVNLIGAHKPEAAATPHPAIVCALTEMLTDRGAQVIVGDSPGGLFTKAFLANIYKTTGMNEAVKYGACLNDDFSVADVENPNAVQLKNFRITKYLTDVDAVINICKIKTHGLMAYTGACKNMFGAIPGMLKSEYHYLYKTPQAFADMLVDLCEYIRPRLCIADAITAMEGNGPSNGEPRNLNMLLASENPHALDMAGAYVIGLDAQSVPTLAAAVKRELVPDDISELDINADLEEFKAEDFKLINKTRDIKKWGTGNSVGSLFLEKMFASYPVIDRRSCIKCERCMRFCPAMAISIVNNNMRIDKRKCINCFCCQEFCPKGAVKVHRPLPAKVINS